MALSNWDTLAVDLDGKPVDGTFTSPLGITVEFYKNWIYVHDPKGWQEGGHFVHDTVMQVQEGKFTYQDVSVEAIRGPQEGIYAVVYWNSFKKDENGIYVKKMTGMVGCSVYGTVKSKWVGVSKNCVKFLQSYITEKTQLTKKEAREMALETVTVSDDNGSLRPPKGKELDRYVQIFSIPEYRFEEIIRNVPLKNVIRFNQGDMYFAKNAGTSLGETKPGEAKEPLITKLIEKI